MGQWPAARGYGDLSPAGRVDGELIVWFVITKDFCSYEIKILRRKKSLRDHGDGLGRSL
jgi:hypothetical protein